MDVNVILQEISRGRLTITPLRVTLKLPEATTQEEIDKLKEKSLLVYNELKAENFDKTWRGRFTENGVSLHTDNNGENKFFKIN